MSLYKSPSINNRPPQVVDSDIYMDIRFDPNATSPTYIGNNLSSSADTSSQDWKIKKLTYSGADIIRVQIMYGSWDGRASLGW